MRTLRGIVFFAALLAAGPATALEAGSRVPEVAFKALGERPAPATLSELRGRVVYVDFWASWCTPCIRSMPALRALHGKHRERGFVVVGVNKDVDALERDRFLRRFPVSFPLVNDADDALAKAFNVKAMPSGYLIDRAGVVRHVHRGFTPETEIALGREIENLLQEKP